MTSPALRALLDEPLGTRHKAFPPALAAVRVADVGARGLNVARGDLLLPALTLREDAVAHNVATMASWCEERGVSLAPHGKTTMAPQLFHRQMAAGAWGMTAATAGQAAIMHEHGIRRVVIANEVVDRAGLQTVCALLAADRTFELTCLVDSVEGVRRMEEALAPNPPAPQLAVLLELGSPGRRAGVRTEADAELVAAAVGDCRHLRLVGVECFEGVAPDREPPAIDEVDRLLRRMGDVARRLDAAGRFARADEILLSAGGSVFFDHAAELRTIDGLSRPTRVLLRSGCYVTHDSGTYDEQSPLGSVMSGDGPRLRAALELWSVVLSRPEPNLAILGFGRRDAPFDAGLPRLLRAGPVGSALRPIDSAEVYELNDQHARVRLPAEAQLAVGDHVVCGISHPCTAFDKWSLLPVVTADGDVVDAVRTLF